MIARLLYRVRENDGEKRAFKPPITFRIAGMSFVIDSHSNEGQDVLLAQVEAQVSHQSLRLARRNAPDDTPTIVVPGLADLMDYARDMVNVVVFIANNPLEIDLLINGCKIVPEGPNDEATIARLGTDLISFRHYGRPFMRSFRPEDVATSLGITMMLRRSVGLRLFADAMALRRDVARFRELWRVLESAFGLSDDKLVRRLAEFMPLAGLNFSKKDLKRLKVLRDRASHAYSRTNEQELRRIEADVDELILPLTSIVERVLLTKKTWGRKDIEVEQLAPLSACALIGQQESLFVVQDPPAGTPLPPASALAPAPGTRPIIVHMRREAGTRVAEGVTGDLASDD